jgi:hypothetical protein
MDRCKYFNQRFTAFTRNRSRNFDLPSLYMFTSIVSTSNQSFVLTFFSLPNYFHIYRRITIGYAKENNFGTRWIKTSIRIFKNRKKYNRSKLIFWIEVIKIQTIERIEPNYLFYFVWTLCDGSERYYFWSRFLCCSW